MLRFTKQDAFVGYQNDTPSSVIFQATEQLHSSKEWNEQIRTICAKMSPDPKNMSSVISQATEQLHLTDDWKRKVLVRSKKILLQMASPDALIRLKNTSLSGKHKRLKQVYFYEQCHGSIVQFLQRHLHKDPNDMTDLLLQVFLDVYAVNVIICL